VFVKAQDRRRILVTGIADKPCYYESDKENYAHFPEKAPCRFIPQQNSGTPETAQAGR